MIIVVFANVEGAEARLRDHSTNHWVAARRFEVGIRVPYDPRVCRDGVFKRLADALEPKEPLVSECSALQTVEPDSKRSQTRLTSTSSRWLKGTIVPTVVGNCYRFLTAGCRLDVDSTRISGLAVPGPGGGVRDVEREEMERLGDLGRAGNMQVRSLG